MTATDRGDSAPLGWELLPPSVTIRIADPNESMLISRPDWGFFNDILELPLEYAVDLSLDVLFWGNQWKYSDADERALLESIHAEHVRRLFVALHWVELGKLRGRKVEYCGEPTLLVGVPDFIALARQLGWELPTAFKPKCATQDVRDDAPPGLRRHRVGRDVLAPVVDRALAAVPHPAESATVWAELERLARLPAAERPGPLVEVTSGGIVWRDGGATRVFTRKALSDRLRRLASAR